MSAAMYALPLRERPAMTTEPAPAYDAPKKGKSPHRMNGRAGTWTFPVHADCLLDMVRMASRLKELADEPYSFEAAVASYTLDTHRGGLAKGKADYERIWGWSEQQLRTRWKDVTEAAENWRSAYGRLTNDRPTDEQRPTNDEQADSSAETQGSNDRPTDEQRPTNGHTVLTLNPNEKENTSLPHEGGEQIAPPKRAKTKAVPPELQALADEIWEAYPKKVGKVDAMPKILQALRKHSPAFILGRTRLYAQSRIGEDPKYTMGPERFYGKERFNDDDAAWLRTPFNAGTDDDDDMRGVLI